MSNDAEPTQRERGMEIGNKWAKEAIAGGTDPHDLMPAADPMSDLPDELTTLVEQGRTHPDDVIEDGSPDYFSYWVRQGVAAALSDEGLTVDSKRDTESPTEQED